MQKLKKKKYLSFSCRFKSVCWIKSERNLLADRSLSEKTTASRPGLSRVPRQIPPTKRPEPSPGVLRQIASLLCKFVQAINSISLGVPIWQQEWLESSATRRLSQGTEMRAELQWSLKLCAIVTSPCSRPRSPSTHLPVPTSVSSTPPFGDAVTGRDGCRRSQRAIL